jgi:uncharacterized RDD family membrane protein YckC
MSDSGGYPLNPDYFVRGVLPRRCVAWVIDGILIAVLVWAVWWVLLLLVIATLGLAHGLLMLVGFVPFAYHMLSLLGSRSATPGQQLLGLTVRRDADLGPPTGIQAFISTLLYYLTLATSGLLLLVALFTTRHRTLHDLVSGLVVVRVDAMEALTSHSAGWNMPYGTSAR